MNALHEVEALWAWVEESRGRVLAALSAAGLSAQVPQRVDRVTEVQDHGAGFHGESRVEFVNVLRGSDESWRVWDLIEWPDDGPLVAFARRLLADHGERCRYFRPWSPSLPGRHESAVEFDANPVDWIVRAYVVPVVLEYLTESTDPRVADRARFDRLVREIGEFAAGDRWRVLEQIPIAGLLAEAELRVDDVSLRPCTPEEMGRWTDPPMFRDRSQRGRVSRFDPPIVATHVLTIEHRPSKLVQASLSRSAAPLLFALQLEGFRIGAPCPETWATLPSWADFGGMFSPLPLPRKFVARPFTQADLARALRLAGQLSESSLGAPTSRTDIALHRFRNALQRTESVDIFLDCMIALEAILLVGEDKELSFRFRVNGAWWIGADAADRAQLHKELGKIYSLRSTLVHGAKYPERSAIDAAAERVVEITRRVLARGLTEGWPTAERFNALVLALDGAQGAGGGVAGEARA